MMDNFVVDLQAKKSKTTLNRTPACSISRYRNPTVRNGGAANRELRSEQAGESVLL